MSQLGVSDAAEVGRPAVPMTGTEARREMAVQMICPNLRCRKFLSVAEDIRGKVVKCHHCQTHVRVPPARKSDPVPAGVGGAVDDGDRSES